MAMRPAIAAAAVAVAAALPGVARGLELASPDGQVVVSFGLRDDRGASGCPSYRVVWRGRTVLTDSRLGLELVGASLGSGFQIVGEARSAADSTWVPVCGERSPVRDRYNQVVIDLARSDGPRQALRLTFRAYDAGVAFRYTVPRGPGSAPFTITNEATQFRFTGDHPAWAVYAAQGDYARGRVPLSRLEPGAERPLTVEVAGDLYAAVTEARLVDYARMRLRPTRGEPHAVEAFLDVGRGREGTVDATPPFSTPWRVVMLGASPGALLERNDLVLNLNDPCALADTSWITPGKIIREVTLSTAGGKACVDFCVSHGLQFIEYDAGWYGHEYDREADARRVHLDPRRNPDPHALDLDAVIHYARERHVGVILYVNRLALERQLDELLPLYQKWGVRGIKFGFVDVGSQQATRWLHQAIRKAAAHRLMVDVHDEFRGTGYQRTYPNLMTVEGVLGNEGFPPAAHDAILPFTRSLTGPGDYTFCWSSPRLKSTHAHQLALSTILYSPWQFLYWYDRPAQVAPEPALEYWKTLPTVWDETRVVQGTIGGTVTVARRKGAQWYVGTIRGDGPGPVEVPLAFLSRGRTYTATIHGDLAPGAGPNGTVAVESRRVDASTVLHATLAEHGGHAVRLVPTAEPAN